MEVPGARGLRAGQSGFWLTPWTERQLLRRACREAIPGTAPGAGFVLFRIASKSVPREGLVAATGGGCTGWLETRHARGRQMPSMVLKCHCMTQKCH